MMGLIRHPIVTLAVIKCHYDQLGPMEHLDIRRTYIHIKELTGLVVVLYIKHVDW
jgi:hypothetical protein